jgi:AraC-like DNA-binding protein
MKQNAAFQKWHHHEANGEPITIFPDGCRDVLIDRRKDKPDRIFLTEYDLCPRLATLPCGTEITGYRLRPGTVVGQDVLDAIAQSPSEAGPILADAVSAPNDLEEAILALTLPGATMQAVSTNLGVSPRTMQRRFRDLALPPPDYWRLLGRVRRAVAMLSLPVTLAEIACDCGFSDQAHMTREFMRWFGKTPTWLCRDAHLLDLLNQPALGNWTGEHISTR